MLRTTRRAPFYRTIFIALFMMFALAQTSQARTYTTATVLVTGVENQLPNGQWDTGTYTVSFGAFSQSVSYGQFSTPSSIASGIAAKYSLDPIAEKQPHLCTLGVCAKASGPSITFEVAYPALLNQISVSTTSTSFSGDTSGWPATLSNVSLSASRSSVTVGQSVTFTATVSPSAATGNVLFLDGLTSLGTPPLISGIASLTISALAVGNHPIIAIYLGNSVVLPVTSAPFSVEVQAPVPVISGLAFDPSPGATTFPALSGPATVGFVINGTNFGPDDSASGTYITLGSIELQTTLWSSTQITVQVPAGTPPGGNQLIVIHLPTVQSNGPATFSVTSPITCPQQD